MPVWNLGPRLVPVLFGIHRGADILMNLFISLWRWKTGWSRRRPSVWSDVDGLNEVESFSILVGCLPKVEQVLEVRLVVSCRVDLEGEFLLWCVGLLFDLDFDLERLKDRLVRVNGDLWLLSDGWPFWGGAGWSCWTGWTGGSKSGGVGGFALMGTAKGWPPRGLPGWADVRSDVAVVKRLSLLPILWVRPRLPHVCP